VVVEAVGATSQPDPLDRPEAGAKAIRGGAVRAASFVVNTLLITAIVPLMTRHLGASDFGRFVTASSVVMIVAGITEFGLSGIGTREYALAGTPQRQRLLGNLLALRTLLTLVGLAIAFVLMEAAGYPSVVVSGMLIAGLGLILLNAQQTLALVLTASLSWGLYSIFELVNTAIIAGGTVLLVLIDARLLPFFYISALSSLAALAVTVVVLRGHVVPPRVDLGYWRRMLGESLPYAAAATVGILYFRIALIVVSLGSSAAQTGYYSTSFKIVEVVSGFAFLMASTAFPILARAGRDDHERLRYGSGRVGDTALIVGVYLALSLVIAAPFVILVVGGSGYRPAVPVLRVQAVTLVATFLGATWSFALLSLREHGRLLRANAFALVLAVGLSLALVPNLAAQGAAIATAATEFGLAGAYWISLSRSHARIRPSLALAPKVLLAAGVAEALALLLPLPSIVLWAIGSLAYVLLLVVTKAFPHELIHALLRHDRHAASSAS
jgi:O-antigen/teichoic acid export membrane protein